MIFPGRCFLAVAAVAGALALGAGGCRRALSPVERGNRDQILELGNGAEPSDLDPHVVTSTPDAQIVRALMEGLTWLDPNDLRPVPGAAERWEISSDNTVYTFHLRPTARWSDGAPVTADDFLYAFRRILSPKLGAEYAYMLFDMVNAEAFNKGEIADFSQVGCRAPDPLTLQITLRYPTPYFLGLLSHHAWFPVQRACIEKYGQIDQRGTAWTRPGHLVGNGPYRLDVWRTNEIIKVVRNPSYWDNAHTGLNGVNFHPIENLQVEEQAFRAGQLHVTGSMPGEKIARYRQEHPDLLRTAPFFTTYFYRLNTTKPPLNDARVRRALSLSIDRQGIVDHVTRGGQTPAFSLVPPGLPGYRPAPFFQEDVAAAQRLLAEAGYPNGEGFPHLQIIFNTSEAHLSIAVAIQAMWKQNLHIDVGVQNMEFKVLVSSMRQLDYQVSRYAWTGDYPDPSSFMSLMIKDGGNNQTGWSSPEYDRLLEVAAHTADPAARMEAFHQAEATLMDGMAILPIYFYTHPCLVAPGIEGWPSNLMDYHPFQWVRLPGAGKETGNDK